jgi:hypothetical protein
MRIRRFSILHLAASGPNSIFFFIPRKNTVRLLAT